MRRFLITYYPIILAFISFLLSVSLWFSGYKLEGIFVGISAGAAAWAGIYKASKDFKKGDNLVIILPDTGERYLSTDLFEA